MKQKVGYITLAIIAVLAVGILIYTANAGKSSRVAYPDLDKLTIDFTPSDFNENEQPYIGDPAAPVKIVEFSDYKCPACKRWNELVLPELKSQYIDTGLAVLYYIDYPFLAPDSNLAALAGESLYQQNQEWFWTYYDKISELQGKKADTWATPEFIMNLVETYIPEADVDLLKKDLEKQTYVENIKKDILIGEFFGVGGTPTVFVNGTMLEDASFESIQRAVEEALK